MGALDEIFGSNNEKEEKLSINKKYAEKFQKFKECQELDRLKQKYGDASVNESSSSESEDDDAEGLTPQIEQDFLNTLTMIKTKDPKIYAKETVFFQQSNEKNNGVADEFKEQAKKPLYLKDYERQRLLEKGTHAFVSDSEDEEVAHRDTFAEIEDRHQLTYNEEQRELKRSLKEAMAKDGNDADDDDDLLKIREKSPTEKERESNDYEDWLEKQRKSKNSSGQYWTRDDLNDNEKFLRDYILGKQYVNGEEDNLPSYNEVIDGINSDEENDEEVQIQKEEEFERKFNFRYEEPDHEFIKRYPRTVTESVRVTDDKRKLKRKERDERKGKEKEKKKEELKKLKNLKRKEIMEKIDKLKEITGNEKIGFLEEDIDIDFDPKMYDEVMQKVFDNEYYEGDEEQKPVFSDDDINYGHFDEENWDEWEGPNNLGEYHNNAEQDGDNLYEPHCEDPDFIMDADYVPSTSKNRKKLTKFAQAVNMQKPLFNPDEKTFEEYFDEYYKLDFEDIIGDLPVRFKYRNVVPNDFGLSAAEILNADDKELNQWCSLKKATRYYTDEEELKERIKFKKKARNKQRKIQAFPSLMEKKSDDEENDINEERVMQSQHMVEKENNKSKMLDIKKSKHLISKPKCNILSKYSIHNKLQSNIVLHRQNWRSNSISNTKHRKRKDATNGNLSNTKLRKLHKQFKGANTKQLNKLSANRLAAYGLDKRKNKGVSKSN